jgi:hypothetical protein
MGDTDWEISMRMRHALVRPSVVWIAIASLMSSTTGIASAAPQAKPATAKPPAKTAAAVPTAATDPGWPRRYANNSGMLILYEPQISEWPDQKRMTLYAAVSFTPAGADKPVLGTVIVDADTRVAIDERLVKFSSFRITQTHFATATKEQVATITAAIDSGIPDEERIMGLDRVLAFVDSSSIRPKNVDGVKADPPVVFYSTKTAILVNLDGDPIWSPIENNDLRYAVNTNWDLFEHKPTASFFLRHNKIWMKAADIKGPWAPAGTLPASFTKLPADDNWKEVRATVPAQSVAASALPSVFVSTVPSELILLRGTPEYVGVTGTKLLWVRNTDADLFRLGSTGPVYYLVAGRWFSAPDFKGPWTFASPSLPDDFKKIPLEHERSRVLASVPGTMQAAEAVLLAQVPQTARVNKKEIKAPEVAYQGEPKFEPIPTTTVARAVNTDKDIIKVGDLYYMCFQGVWFVSKSASGPWEVTDTVPKQIYEIPISSPSHNVTYVTVEDDDDDEWVVFAAAAAYTGVMIAWGCAVWGSGWYYPPYVGYGGFYPAYFPYYPTYGYGASYNPWTGAYTRGAVAYGPYGGAGVGSRYNPRTGTYSRGAAAYGPYGARGAATAYNPRTGTSAATRQGSNVYGSWGSTAVQRGDNWAQTSRVTSNVTGNTTRVTRGSEGGTAVSRTGGPGGGGVVGQTGSGNVYAGRDGNVYRKNGDSWQQYDNGNWNSVARPEQRSSSGGSTAAQRETPSGATAQPRTTDRSTIDQLNRDAASRSDGAQRTRDATSVRSGSSGARSGSYRPSGGARGGGGRRR